MFTQSGIETLKVSPPSLLNLIKYVLIYQLSVITLTVVFVM